jgi:acetyltransferase-like isoleucine patch superfamily enzyme
MMRLRLAVSLLIAVTPFSWLRLMLYRGLLGYVIGPGARIGALNLLACRSVRLGAGAVIGRGNVFRGGFDLVAGERLFVGDLNVFHAPNRLDHAAVADRGYAARIEFGDDCLVNDRHFLDGHGRLRVGSGTWIAGRGSQFWTHGVGVRDRDIAIGRGCFVGSAVRFAPGSGLGDRNLVGIGSVVVGRLDVEACLVSGFPAKPVRSIAADLVEGRYRFTRADWAA